jgi:hypothetical protein
VILPLAWFLWFFARRVEAHTGSPWARDLLVVGLGLGTMMYPYGIAFVGHAQSAALLFAGFALLLAPGAGAGPGTEGGWPPRRLVLAGLLTGFSVFFEYQTLFAAALVAGYAAVSARRRAGWFLLGALAPAVLLAAYHAALFGSPFTLPYAHLDDPGFTMYHHSQGFLGLGRPRGRVLVASFLHVDYGLFVFSPFLAVGFGLAVWAALRRGSRPHALVALTTVAMAVFLAGMANWRGGWCAGGPRYIAAVVPLLTFALALSWRQLFPDGSRAPLAVGLGGLVVFSVVVCALSGGIFPHFPLQFDNPVFDLVLPLLRSGHAPHSLGTAVGLSGLPSLLPLALVVAVAIATVLLPSSPASLAGWRPRLVRAGLTLAVAAALLVALGLLNRRPSRQEDRARDLVMDMWEPDDGR